MAYKCKRKLANDLIRRYNISVAIYEAILKGCDYSCMICGRHEDEVGRLNIDHCHSEGTARGMICRDCNLGLANFKDDPAMLRKAANYLENNLEDEL